MTDRNKPTPDELEALAADAEALDAAASPGPWLREHRPIDGFYAGCAPLTKNPYQSSQDAAFIAFARRVLPELAALARREAASLRAEQATPQRRPANMIPLDCGQDTVCATPPGCGRHWEERNRELVQELTALRKTLPDDDDQFADPGLVRCGTFGPEQPPPGRFMRGGVWYVRKHDAAVRALAICDSILGDATKYDKAAEIRHALYADTWALKPEQGHLTRAQLDASPADGFVLSEQAPKPEGSGACPNCELVCFKEGRCLFKAGHDGPCAHDINARVAQARHDALVEAASWLRARAAEGK